MGALKILIVEDDLLLAENLSEELIEFGYTITDIVSNSDEGLLAFRRRMPDLILMDIRLNNSKLDGVELTKVLNEIERVPVIFLTAYGDAKTIERVKAVNPAYYLIKPCNSTQLKVAIDFALNNFARQIEPDPAHSLQPQTQSEEHNLHVANDYFFVKQQHKYIRIEVADIVWVEAAGAYVKIVTDTLTVTVPVNLNSFSHQVNHDDLIRVQRSYMINRNKVTAFDAGRFFISYQDGQQEIPIGKTYKDDLGDNFPRLKSD